MAAPSLSLSEVVDAPTVKPKRVPCVDCERTYSSKSHLNRHVKNVHNPKLVGPSGDSLPTDSAKTSFPITSPEGSPLPVNDDSEHLERAMGKVFEVLLHLVRLIH